MTASVCPDKTLVIDELLIFQILIRLSLQPPANEPSLSIAKVLTYQPSALFNILIIVPVSIFQILIELSEELLANEPSLNTTNDVIRPLCPDKLLTVDSELISQILIE